MPHSARSKRGSDMQRWPREPGINCRCPRTTEANSRATAQVVRGQRNADPASTHRTPQSFPTFVRRHSPFRPTVKLEFAALQHYLVLDRALTPPSRFGSTDSIPPPGLSVTIEARRPLPRRAFVISPNRRRRRRGCPHICPLPESFRDRRSRAPIDRRYTSSVRSAARSSRAGF